MARPPRKQKDVEEREGDLLKIARRLFLAKGLEGLTMEGLAAETVYSKGTLYQSFASKEDVFAALCIESGRYRLALLERAALFKGSTRERAMALAKADYVLYRLYTDYWRTEQISNVLSLGSKISPQRKDALDALAGRGAEIALGVIREGIALGELQLPEGLGAEQVFLGLLGFSRGLYLYCSGTSPFAGWSGDTWVSHERLFSCACDGFGWRPYSREWDYATTGRRIWTDVFAPEASLLSIPPGTGPQPLSQP